MATQNRYYSNLSQATFLGNPPGLNNSETDLQASGTTNWPTAFPFTVIIEPNTGNTEIVLITGGSGTAGSPYSMVRGYDGTTAKPHNVSVPMVPGPCQADFAEPQVHLNLSGPSSGAHGLPSSAWNGGTMQLLSKTVTLSTQSSITTPAIANTFNNLRVIVVGKSTYTTGGVTEDDLLVQYNGISSNFYGDLYNLYVASGGGGGTTPTSYMYYHTSAAAARAGCVATNNVTSGSGRSVIEFPSYSDTVWEKSHNFFATLGDAGTAGQCMMQGGGSCSLVTTAITGLTFTLGSFGSGGLFTANTTVFVYGY